MPQKEELLRSEIVYQGAFLRIAKDLVKTPDGHQKPREYILHPGAALIVPVLDDGRFVLEKQYRHPVGQLFLEFPAGKCDPGEHTEASARRELLEETGYRGSDWTFLGRIHPCIGYSNEFIDFYLATGLSFEGAQLDPGENLEVVLMTQSEFEQEILSGRVTDAKTLSAYFWYLVHQKGARG